MTSAKHFRPRLEHMGFTNVVQLKYAAPLAPWAPESDPASRRLGALSQAVVLQLLRPFTLSTIVAAGLWPFDEVEGRLVDVRRDLLDAELHAYVPM